MINKKAQRLIELVKGKTLLREAPTRRDVILHVYGIDIDDPNTKDWNKYFVKKKFTNLLRSVRDKEEKAVKDPYSLHSQNDCQFYMIQDEETKIWHCVHIIQEINGNYLIKWGRTVQKSIETRRKTVETVTRNAMLSGELREAMKKNEIKRRWSEKLMKERCTPKQIRSYISFLRQDGKIQGDYKPNIKGIQHVFGDNAGEIKYTVSEYSQIQLIPATTAFSQENAKNAYMKTYQNHDELIKTMLKEIILCDYERRDYHLPEPQRPDYLGIGVEIEK